MKKIDRDKLGRLILRRAEEELSQGRICGKEITVLQDGERVFHGVFGSAAGGGLASTASDFSVFAETLRLGGVSPSGVRILSEEAVRLMRTPNVPESIPMGYERWGLGVRVIVDSRYPHGLCPGCFGWSGAYGTHFWVDPENRITAVMMKNSRYDGGAGNMSACGFERDVYDSAEV